MCAAICEVMYTLVMCVSKVLSGTWYGGRGHSHIEHTWCISKELLPFAFGSPPRSGLNVPNGHLSHSCRAHECLSDEGSWLPADACISPYAQGRHAAVSPSASCKGLEKLPGKQLRQLKGFAVLLRLEGYVPSTVS